MLRALAVAAIAIPAATPGCAGPCIDEVCLDNHNEVTYPGPCRSVSRNGTGVKFAYDDNNRLAWVGSSHSWESGTESGTNRQESRWHYDADGNVESLVQFEEASSLVTTKSRRTWTIDGPRVVVTTMCSGYGCPLEPPPPTIYDRARFAFVPDPRTLFREPAAELALVEVAGVPIEWRSDGNLHTSVYRTAGGETVSTYEVDERGRIIRSQFETATWSSPAREYAYDDADRLIASGVRGHGMTAWMYDAAGNLVELLNFSVDGAFEGRALFDYACW